MNKKDMNSISRTILNNHMLDIEDLHLIGVDQNFCPYYYSIDSCRDADIIFMPYNYLVDPSIRPPTVNINNSIVIFDEAHNIESICCDSVSFELRAETLSQCIAEVQQILELNKSPDDCLVSKEELITLKKILLKLEQVIDEINIPSTTGDIEPSIMKPGKYIFDILKDADITMDVKDTILDVAQDVLRELISPEAELTTSITMSSTINNNKNNSKYALEIFIKALETIFSKKFDEDSFRVNISIKKRQTTNFMSTQSKS